MEKVMGRKSDTKVKVTGVKLPPKPKPEPVVSFNNVKDHHGRKYVYNPLAKLPYSRHSILYPDDVPCGDEDIPLQHGHEGNVGINGASPFLLMAAAHTSLSNSTSRLPYRDMATAHLQMALELLAGEEAFLTELQKLQNSELRNASEVLVMAATHVISIHEQKSPALRKTVCESLNNAESTAVHMIAIPPAVAGNYRKLIEMVQKPVR
jgi:uncharacterized membrane protein